VIFLNAGTLGSEELKEHVQEAAGNFSGETFTHGIRPEESIANMTLEDRLPEEELLSSNAIGNEDKLVMAHERNGLRECHAEPGPIPKNFFTDVKGSKTPAETGFPKPVPRRSLSVASSDSSEEVIIFSGRNRPRANVKSTTGHNGSFNPKPTPNFELETLINTTEPMKPSCGHRITELDDPVSPNMDETMPAGPAIPLNGKSAAKSSSRNLIPLNHGAKPRQSRQSKRRKRSLKQFKEDMLIADYIENMEDDKELNDPMNGNALFKRELRIPDSHRWQDQSSDFKYTQQPSAVSGGSTGWDSTDLQDLDDLSTSDDVPAIVESVLSKRTRPSGIQYLIVCGGYTADDARWIPSTSLDTPRAEEQIRIFETQLVELKESSFDCENSEDSVTVDEKVAMDLQGEPEDSENEQDLQDRKRARMTDEQIARLLSKQEELGLGSDELVLFDGDEEEGSKGWNDEASSLPLSVWNQPLGSQKRKTRSRRELRSTRHNADVLEQDPYNGFDVMDHDRPSLRKKPKGHRGQLTLELSDSELENSIQTAWENDRSKKKSRKQEREELRAHGLLGKKGKIDMKAKYKEGMSWEDVKKEIAIFLVSSKETWVSLIPLLSILANSGSLPLPPMNPYDRKKVHEIANVFNLKSKSVGGGTSRFPTLYKTFRTTSYDEDALSGIEARLDSKRFMHRPDKSKAKGPTKNLTTTRRARGGVFASAGVSYRDGEVVGATAPEIGSENRGRTMLERMGWSTGTALGAMNNKGIMQPVTHVVKTTKAGLG